jgi:hypothetical protein
MGPVMAGGLLYVLSNSGEFIALDPMKQGCIVWSMHLKDIYAAPPIVIQDGFLFFSATGKLSFYKRP